MLTICVISIVIGAVTGAIIGVRENRAEQRRRKAEYLEFDRYWLYTFGHLPPEGVNPYAR